ncbi:LysR family transcriptional regulator [Sphingobium yanoikuyae]|uniref:LysR family transcriptional regulator n=1 Tax=Sphingobium yanoikuyae TaxID=13690 RepID=A0A9X7UB21_SPHYA|nr:LysR family transcriptional regulator [Sphingobium yanoikuyae]QNG43972.1 LysR family transcriptional regulator [Sphingobium yanoikuyae]
MRDLNDYYLFHAVVTHRGFSAAQRATGITKGTLSKAVARLEDRLGVRLLERTTRKLGTTEVGRAFYEQVEIMLTGADGAEAAAAQAHAEPCGLVRVACPQGLIQNLFGEILPRFMLAYPKVRLQLKVINRRADFVDDAIDVALRARSGRDDDSSLIVRPLGATRLVLAMSPRLRNEVAEIVRPDDLTQYPTLSMSESAEEDQWELVGPDGEMQIVAHQPRLLCRNTDMLSAAATDGLGVALLPEHVALPYLASGSLVRVLPEWCSPVGTVQAAFPTKKGMLPAVRALIDYLASEVPKVVMACSV